MTARLGQYVRYGLLQGILAIVLLASGPLAGRVHAAPFADYVIDARTGEVLHAKNADTRLHPASLTKMMTLYITFEAIERGEISLDTMVTVSKHAAAQPPSRLGLRAGQKIALRYLIRAAAIKSANDAATAIGEAVEGSEPAFAKRMNRTAKALGMTRTTFRNANGLTADGHLSTAHDMTTLGRRLFFDYPQYYNLFSRRTADAGMAQVRSTNARFLDSYEGADGIKTGYTGPAGFNLVASAQRGNKRIIATVFGGTSTAQRNAKVAELLDLGFGKAPNKAPVQKPLPPQYLADATEAGDDIAAAVAADVAEAAPGGAAKTIRVSGSVLRSQRPKSRPVPGNVPEAVPSDEPMLLAEAQTSALPGAPVADAQAGAMDEDAFAGLSDGVAAALAEVAAEPVFAQTASPQPETLAMVEAPATTDAASPEPTVVAALPDLADKRPQARPAAAMPEAVAVAEAAPLSAQDTDPAEALVVAEATPGAEEADAAGAAMPAAVTLLSAPAATVPTATALAAAEPRTLGAKTIRPAPQPKPDEIILASVEPVGPSLPLEQEVISRVSTSGGREFGISLGNYPSRYEAERVLLQTALTEIGTLDEALRKVVNRKGGFDATFIGLTGEMADLACRRLEARNATCRVIGP